MAGIFISYRRHDSAGWAGHLADSLKESFGADQIFMDIETIEAGVDFVEVLQNAVSSCNVLIAVIGPQWLASADVNGRRRLDQPNDFIRLEIATALQRNIRVIPVLVGGASMPNEDDLPPDLRSLARRQADELSDTRWEFDTEQMVKVLEKILGKPSLKRREDVVPGSSESPVSGRQTRAKKINLKAIISLGLALFVLLVFFSAESLGWNTVVGGLVISVVALVLGIAGYYDAKLNKVRSKGLAVTDIVLSAIFGLAVIGKSPMTSSNVEQKYTNQDVIAKSEQAASKSPMTSLGVQSEPAAAPESRKKFIHPEEERGDVDISGSWQSSDGYSYEFQQRRNQLHMQVKTAHGVLISSGEGMIAGENASIKYMLSDNTYGELQLRILREGTELQGTYTNVSTGFSGSVALQRHVEHIAK